MNRAQFYAARRLYRMHDSNVVARATAYHLLAGTVRATDRADIDRGAQVRAMLDLVPGTWPATDRAIDPIRRPGLRRALDLHQVTGNRRFDGWLDPIRPHNVAGDAA